MISKNDELKWFGFVENPFAFQKEGRLGFIKSFFRHGAGLLDGGAAVVERVECEQRLADLPGHGAAAVGGRGAVGVSTGGGAQVTACRDKFGKSSKLS